MLQSQGYGSIEKLVHCISWLDPGMLRVKASCMPTSVLLLLKMMASAALISFASGLAGKKPGLAGFIIALPLTTLIALAFTQVEHQDTQKSVEFAKSILLGVPLSLTFFIPFLFADRLKEMGGIGFWGLYTMGLVLLSGSYFLHRMLLRL